MTSFPLNLLRRLAVAATALGLAAVSASAATSITQFGITWTFDRDYPTGQFANGDHWVIGPVTITNITPRSTAIDGITMHGSMINPTPNTAHGFDSRIKSNTFDANKNVARTFPLIVAAGSSILSSESYVTLASGNNPQLKTIAILTVLASEPAAGSFRPPYAGADKSIRWNVSQLDYSKLRSLPPVTSIPSLSTLETTFEKPFIDIKSSWAGTYLQPLTNHPAYGREISHQVASGLLSLQLNYTDAQKEKLLVRMVQRGLDIYGLASLGANWNNDGGHRHGRKPLLLLAGTVLKDSTILAFADAQKKFIFQEDQQTFYVSMTDVLTPRKTSDGRYREPYTVEMIGTPEWGGRHTGEPQGDAAQWDTYYRDVCGASTVGTVLAARLMGWESAWNWPALFDYIDRYWPIESVHTATSTNYIQPFVKAMWAAYRYSTPAPLDPDTTAVDAWVKTSFAEQTGSFSASFDMMASRTGLQGFAGVSQGAASLPTQLAAGLRLNSSGTIDAINGTGYSAANLFTSTPGVSYRVVLLVDIATRTYSATVTAPGGSPVTIASDYAFTSGYSATSLDAVSFYATFGALSVTGVSAQTIAPPPEPPVTDPEPPVTDPEPPAPEEPNEVWHSVSLGDRSGSFTVSFDLTPASNSVTGAVGLSWGAAAAESSLVALVGLNPEGNFQAHNGSGYAVDSKLTYSSGVTYRVTLTVDLGKKRYTAAIQPPGAKNATVIARNYALPATPTKVNTLSYYAIDDRLVVKNVATK